MKDICESIRVFNRLRDPERLAMKYEKMRTNEYVFLRGSCHLFYELLEKYFAATLRLGDCGDLHLENFGSYKGSNRLTYFDINDFDGQSSRQLRGTWCVSSAFSRRKTH